MGTRQTAYRPENKDVSTKEITSSINLKPLAGETVKKNAKMPDDNLTSEAVKESLQAYVENLSLKDAELAASKKQALSTTIAETDLWRYGSIIATFKAPYTGRHLPPGEQIQLNIQSRAEITLKI